MSEDWLAIEDDSAPPTAVVVALPEDLAARNAAFAAAWSELTSQQQTILRTLRDYNFNISKTLRALVPSGEAVTPRTLSRWKREDAFMLAYRMIQTATREERVDQDRIHLRLDEIAEQALEGTDILFQGQPTGYRERNYTASLKATELQMKATRMLEDKETGGFGGRNITLAVQVVMPSGELKDVAPKGVVIDVPVIEVKR